MPEAGYPLHTFDVRGFERRLSPALAASAWKAATAPVACRRIISRVQPDVVFGAGGYVSGPMLLAARASRVPGALLEVDAHMGLANRLAAPLVERVYLSFPIEGRAGGQVPGHRPVRSPAASRADAGEAWSGDVLVFGGSLGATRLNAAAAPWAGGDLAGAARHRRPRVRAVPRAGRRRYRVRALPDRAALGAARRRRWSVARAGGSIFEIAAAGKPSILIPSPNVTADHQTANARHLERAGARRRHPRRRADARAAGRRGAGAAGPTRSGCGGWGRRRSPGRGRTRAAVIADDLLRLHRR